MPEARVGEVAACPRRRCLRRAPEDRGQDQEGRKASVYIDKKLVATIDLKAAKTQAQRIVYAAKWATSGKHAIKIVCQATSGRPTIDLDAFVLIR